MDYLYIIVLAIIQGIAEFLPISSSGHLVLVSHLFEKQDINLLLILILNLGTLCALILFFFREFISIFDVRKKENLFLWLYLFVATVMTMVIGLFLKSITHNINSLTILSIGFFITAGFLYTTRYTAKEDQELSLKKSLIIGFIQGLAVLPGVSRSGSTISVGRNLGLKNKTAFLFSFMLSIPVGLGALLLESIQYYQKIEAGLIVNSLSFFDVITGLIISFLFGLGALKLFYRLYMSVYFYRFAYYCLAIGLTTLLLGVGVI